MSERGKDWGEVVLYAGFGFALMILGIGVASRFGGSGSIAFHVALGVVTAALALHGGFLVRSGSEVAQDILSGREPFGADRPVGRGRHGSA